MSNEYIAAGFVTFMATLELLVCGAVAAESSAPVTAIWRVQELKIVHRDARTLYSCAELTNRITSILGTLGARVANGTRTRCTSIAPGTQSLHIAFLRPVEATQANLREASEFSSIQRLSARVRGETLPDAADLERFPAVWQTVVLHRVRGVHIDNRDCALFETMKQQAFPHLGINIPAEGFSCPSHVATHIRPRVVARALVPLNSDLWKSQG